MGAWSPLRATGTSFSKPATKTERQAFFDLPRVAGVSDPLASAGLPPGGHVSLAGSFAPDVLSLTPPLNSSL